jgi:glycosyltransferase involved in cell wall biosynthesis
MSKKKILYIVTQSEFGGAQRYVFDLATHIKNEFDVAVAAGPPATPAAKQRRASENPNGELFRHLDSSNIRYKYISCLKRRISPFYDLVALFQLRRLIKKEKPDIVHLNSSKAGILGSIAAKSVIHGPKVVYTAHGWVFNEPNGWLKQKIYLWLEKLTAKCKDKIVCVSDYDHRIVIAHGFPKTKLITVHNGLDFGGLNFLPRDEARQKLLSKIPPSPPFAKGGLGGIFIGSIANLYPTKGLEYLIEAAHIIKTNHLSLTYSAQGGSAPGGNLSFVIIGEGPERKKLEKLIKKYGLENNFFLLGDIPDARQYLKAFDVFVLPSVKEGFPYAVLEAMAAGAPIVATNVGGIPEMASLRPASVNERTVLAEPAILLSEPKNSQQLAENILYFLNHPKEAAELAKREQQIVKTNFGLTEMVRKTTEVYIWS